MNAEYYLNLVEKYFEAELSEEQEAELVAFLSGCDDPRFDEAKAVMSYLLVGKTAYARKAQPRNIFSPAVKYITSAAAAVILLVAGFALSSNSNRIIRSDGTVIRDSEIVIGDMNNTLADLFSDDGADAMDILQDLFDNNF